MAKSSKASTAGTGSRKKKASEKVKVEVEADVEQPLPRASKDSATRPPSLMAEERRIQVLLGQGAYHLSSNKTWYQDFGSYVCNNHPLFAACFQSPLHPIGKGMRAVGLLGSICFGLVLTNAIYMWQLYGQDEEEDSDETIFVLSAGGFAVSNGTSVTYLNDDNVISQYAPGFEVSSTAMLVLWTVGSASHSIFDSLLWYASSCQCCLVNDNSDIKTQSKTQSNLRKYCNILIVLLVVLVTTVATLAVVVRAMLEDDDGSDSLNAMLAQNDGNTTNPELSQLLSQNSAAPLKNKNNYGFLQAYAIELALAWFLWFFVIEGLLFSGVLSCRQRCFPSILGGRPYEVQQEQHELKAAAEATKVVVRKSKCTTSKKKKKPKDSSPKHSSTAAKKKATKRSSAARVELNKTPYERASKT